MVAKDGRLKPGDQILEVYIISSQNIHIYNFLDDVKKVTTVAFVNHTFFIYLNIEKKYNFYDLSFYFRKTSIFSLLQMLFHT